MQERMHTYIWNFALNKCIKSIFYVRNTHTWYFKSCANFHVEKFGCETIPIALKTRRRANMCKYYKWAEGKEPTVNFFHLFPKIKCKQVNDDNV